MSRSMNECIGIRWNKTECLKFLREFDAFEHKYLYNLSDYRKNGKHKQYVSELWHSVLSSQSHGAANHNFSCDEEAEAALGIKQVYFDEKHYTNEYIEMLDLVRDKFIYDYAGIPGLCHFFSPAYFEYEWGMHLEIDYERHNSRYYRDHYVHQIRTMFEMFTLLDKYGYYEKCRKAYEDPENVIGTFIFETINKEILSMNCSDKELYGAILDMVLEKDTRSDIEDIRTHMKDIRTQIKEGSPSYCEFPNELLTVLDLTYANGKDDTSNLYSPVYRQIPEKHRKELSEMMFHYIIYAAIIIASIVHDIGYPIGYIRRICGRLNKYLTISKLLASVNKDYSAISRALQNSLLFQTVKSEIIEQRLDDDDHGAQSAIVLLMYFHLHSNQLSNLQRCAVELAALVIYNHTNKYKIIDRPKPGRSFELIRSDIYKEPLSHVFRMCDDLQEWDRVYFEITDKSNIFICPVCHTPILRKFGTDIEKPECKKYSCCCRNGDRRAYYDTSWFVNRRIINVIGCDSIMVKCLRRRNIDSSDITADNNGSSKKGSCIGTLFIMQFDCGALLNVVTFSKIYGRVRAKGVSSLKRLCAYQGALDTVLIDAFVSNNPFVIKIKILEEYVRNFLYPKEIGRNGDSLAVYIARNTSKIIKKILNMLSLQEGDNVYWLFKINLKFYFRLFKLGEKFKEDCEKIIDSLPIVDVSGLKSYWGKPVKDLRDLINHHGVNFFDELDLNTTNKQVLDKYDEFYKKLCRIFKNAAKSMLWKTANDFSRFLKNNSDTFELCVDYIMQQAHRLGYEKIKDELTGGLGGSNCLSRRSIQKQIIYRRFYEKLYCTDAALDEQVDKYVSRDAYDRVKELCWYNNGKSTFDEKYNHIDFFSDYGLLVGLWEKIKEQRKFFFDIWGVDANNKYVLLNSNNIKHISHMPSEVNTKTATVLECITQSEEFYNEYKFNVLEKCGERYDREAVLTVIINWEDHSAEFKVDPDKKNTPDLLAKVKKILKLLLAHHNIIKYT